TIAIPLDFQANSCFSSTQGACSWFFRHYDPAGLGWPKMTFAGDHWQGPGPNQQIRANSASPGDQPVARFWKSAFASNVRISGEPWASSVGGEFNFDFNVSFTEAQQREGKIEYNYERGGHAMDMASVPPVVL